MKALLVALALHADCPADKVQKHLSVILADLPARVILADYGDITVSLKGHNARSIYFGLAWRFGPRRGLADVYVNDLLYRVPKRRARWDFLHLFPKRLDEDVWAIYIANVAGHEVGHCLGLPHGEGIMVKYMEWTPRVKRFTKKQLARMKRMLR